jgi:hypothetical protein
VKSRSPQFVRRHPALVIGSIVCAAALVILTLLVLWESGYECVRWSTRINVDEYGGVTRTRVCAETRPRWGENVGR